MARHKSAIKRMRQNLKRRARNRSVKSAIKTFSKSVLSAVESKDEELVRQHLKKAASFIDKSVSKGILHRNTASRKISKLTRKVNLITRPDKDR